VRRLLLISNSNASTVTRRVREVITKALSADFDLRVANTKRGGHATYVARGAVHEGVDLVVALGGDGTVNEVANGLAGTDVPLGILPGGGTNVFARTLGIPRDVIEATTLLLQNGTSGAEPRTVPLGRADGRYFAFTCGLGVDGAIVRQVERRQRLKKAVGEWYFVWSGLRTYFTGFDRRRPTVRLSWGPDLEHRREGLYFAICQNSDPFTFLGDRPFRLCPQADLDGGLDLLSSDSMRVRTILPTVLRAFGSARHVGRRHLVYLHDERRILVECSEPLPMQMDGEFLGDRTRVELDVVPGALRVLTG